MHPRNPSLRLLTLTSALLLFGGDHLASAADKAGSKDHPLIKRFEGSEIVYFKQSSYDQLKLALETIVFNYNDQKFNPYKSLTVEGRLTTIYYAVPAGVPPLEVIRNYQNELAAKGFETLFQAAGDAIERNKGDNLAYEIYGVTPENTNQQHPEFVSLTMPDRAKSQYLAAKLARPTEGDVYVSVLALESSYTAAGAFKIPEKTTLVRLDVCEVKPMEQRMVTVSAGEMANEITSSGKVALYGILFDFNKTEIKPESAPTLEQIAKLLTENAKLRILVVGHTDGIGSFDSNKTLSQKRAEAVVAALSTTYHIDPKRLFPVGVSFASPVATNTTEEGRAKNRRVELVEMIQKD